MTRGRARRYLLVKQGYYPQVVADAGYTVFDWSTLNAGTLFQDSAKTTPASANGDVIGCWTDGVGGVDATQATTANKPGLATGTLNGLPTIAFDGSDLLTAASIAYGTFAIWLVAAITNNNSVSFARSGSAERIYKRAGNNIEITVIRSAVTSQKTTTGTIGTGYYVLRYEFNGTHTSHKIYADNANLATTDNTINDPGTGNSTLPVFIGSLNGSLPITGNIGQLLIMSPYPTDASIIVNMESYINNVWNGVY